MTHVIGFAEFRPAGLRDDPLRFNPLRYKTEVFEISSGTSISEIYDYFANPTIYMYHTEPIPHIWGDENSYPVIPYWQIDHEWLPTTLPQNPIVLRWSICECDSNGNNTLPIFDLTTPLANTTHYEG